MKRIGLAGRRSRLPPWPRRVRTRLAVLYASLFLLAGAALLAVTYELLASRLPTPAASKSVALRSAGLTALCKQPHQNGKVPEPVSPRCKRAYSAGAAAVAKNDRSRTLSELLDASLLALAVLTICSAGVGWLASGRVLRPVRAITEAARRASAEQLGERLALAGPQDELKELADTFDEMLERLDAAFDSQKRFVANAAHELRTPLTAMRTAIEVTLAKPGHTAAQLEAMSQRVSRSIERSEATIDALLTLAVSEQGVASAEPNDLATAAEDALDAVSAAIARRGLEVETELDPAPVRGDRVLLERMIANLVDNAVRHNHEHGWISVRTGQRGAGALFEIANTGPMVAEDSVAALFQPFVRSRERLSLDEGVGLGLSIADAIARAHGTVIAARARSEGGLEVSVLVPGAPGALSGLAAPGSAAPASPRPASS